MSAISSRPRITAVRIPAITEFAVDGVSTSEMAIDSQGESMMCAGAAMAGETMRRAVLDAVVAACSAASVAAGFTDVQLRSVSSDESRLVAFNPAGQSLVSEILLGADTVSLATEVVGIRDGSCGRVLDNFDATIEAEGIRSAAPHRKFTGGVAELASAKEVLRRFTSRLTPSKLDDSPSPETAGPRRAGRARQNNQRQR